MTLPERVTRLVLPSLSADNLGVGVIRVADDQRTEHWPTGQVALVFTDVERSTELWQIDEEAFEQALVEHDHIVRQLTASFGGVEVKHTGDGFFLVFPDPGRAGSFCIDLQTSLAEHPWPVELGTVRTRIGLHVGRPRLHDGDYRGPAVNLASRICNASAGGQILTSREAAAKLWPVPGLASRLVVMGSYPLPGLAEPVEIYELRCDATEQFDFRPLSPLPATGDQASGAMAFDDDDEERWKRVKIALREADNAKAIVELAILRERHPRDVKVLTALGVAYGIEKEYASATECLQTAVELDPAHAGAWFNLARVYGKMGRRERIAHALEMALKADPQHPKARAVAAKYGIELPG